MCLYMSIASVYVCVCMYVYVCVIYHSVRQHNIKTLFL